MVAVHGRVAEALARAEDLARWVADKIPGEADPHSEKYKLLKYADECADLGAGLDTSSAPDSIRVIDLDGLAEVLR